jgi:hypothetical protein
MDRAERLRGHFEGIVQDPLVWKRGAAIMSMHETPSGEVYLQDAGLPQRTWTAVEALGGTPVDVLEKLPVSLMINRDIVCKAMPSGFFGWVFLCQAWVKTIDEEDHDKAYAKMQALAGKVKDQPDKFEAVQIYGVLTDGIIVMALEPHEERFRMEKSFDIHRPGENGGYTNPNLARTRMYEALTKANRTVQRIGAGK